MITKKKTIKKFKAIGYQRVFYEAIFKAEDKNDAVRMVNDLVVIWKKTHSDLDKIDVSIEEIKNG